MRRSNGSSSASPYRVHDNCPFRGTFGPGGKARIKQIWSAVPLRADFVLQGITLAQAAISSLEATVESALSR
jgi:hypothetical protein